MSPQTTVFLLAGNRLLREALSRILKTKSDISVAGTAPYSPQAIQQIAESNCQILLLDSVTSAASDFQFVRRVIEVVPGLKVIMIGMDENEEAFLSAVRAGVFGYVPKDASATDVVAAVRAVAQDEAVCPPRLCLSLFKLVCSDSTALPTLRIRYKLGLTRRQQQLVPLIAQGLTNKEIAMRLNLSEQTVKNHIHRMLQRVGADDRLAVVEMVREQGVFV